MKYRHFSVEEREQIQWLWWQRKSIRCIADAIRRSPSSVARELKRNFPPERQVYSPRLANERALRKRHNRGRAKRLKNKEIREYVVARLKQGWSPEQVAGRMKRNGVGSISHEAIYQYVYARVSKASDLVYANQEDLRPYLRLKRKRRIRKGLRSSQRFRYIRGLSINQRPIIVASRNRIGDWEGDTMVSKDHRPGLNTLLERKTGLVLMTKLTDNTSQATARAVIDRFKLLPLILRQTLTVDNGPENSQWQSIEAATSVTCFFANPYHSWERGANENVNGLIREYFPKKTDFNQIPSDEIAQVEYILNSRPRKRLGYQTPLEALSVALDG